MFAEFRRFVARGNVLDLAVAVLIGAAFGRIVTSLTEDVLMPVIGGITGDLDFSNYFVVLGGIPETYTGSRSYAALKAAGIPLLGYGAFATAVLNFLILAFIVFWLVRTANKVMRREEAKAATPEDVLLLREIRDELRRRP
jgi:large conductance mechanosensitive channel